MDRFSFGVRCFFLLDFGSPSSPLAPPLELSNEEDNLDSEGVAEAAAFEVLFAEPDDTADDEEVLVVAVLVSVVVAVVVVVVLEVALEVEVVVEDVERLLMPLIVVTEPLPLLMAGGDVSSSSAPDGEPLLFDL